MRRLLLSFGLVAALTLALTAPATAQTMPRGDVAMSYSLLYDNDLPNGFPGMSGVLPAGWLFSASGRVMGPLSIVGEVGANYKPVTINDVDVTLGVFSYLGGVRYRPRLDSEVRPFAQFLIGLARASASSANASISDNAFTSQVGGGVDISVTTKVAVRVQGDYRGLNAHGFSWSEFRFATGVVYNF